MRLTLLALLRSGQRQASVDTGAASDLGTIGGNRYLRCALEAPGRWEILYCIRKTGGALEFLRGQEGTVDGAWPAGSLLKTLPTDAAMGGGGEDGVSFIWRGAWSGATAYVANDVVSSGGNSYICILGHTNHAPPNGTYWQVMAQKGEDGEGGGGDAGSPYPLVPAGCVVSSSHDFTDGASGDDIPPTSIEAVVGNWALVDSDGTQVLRAGEGDAGTYQVTLVGVPTPPATQDGVTCYLDLYGWGDGQQQDVSADDLPVDETNTVHGFMQVADGDEFMLYASINNLVGSEGWGIALTVTLERVAPGFLPPGGNDLDILVKAGNSDPANNGGGRWLRPDALPVGAFPPASAAGQLWMSNGDNPPYPGWSDPPAPHVPSYFRGEAVLGGLVDGAETVIPLGDLITSTLGGSPWVVAGDQRLVVPAGGGGWYAVSISIYVTTNTLGTPPDTVCLSPADGYTAWFNNGQPVRLPWSAVYGATPAFRGVAAQFGAVAHLNAGNELGVMVQCEGGSGFDINVHLNIEVVRIES